MDVLDISICRITKQYNKWKASLPKHQIFRLDYSCLLVFMDKVSSKRTECQKNNCSKNNEGWKGHLSTLWFSSLLQGRLPWTYALSQLWLKPSWNVIHLCEQPTAVSSPSSPSTFQCFPSKNLVFFPLCTSIKSLTLLHQLLIKLYLTASKTPMLIFNFKDNVISYVISLLISPCYHSYNHLYSTIVYHTHTHIYKSQPFQ